MTGGEAHEDGQPFAYVVVWTVLGSPCVCGRLYGRGPYLGSSPMMAGMHPSMSSWMRLKGMPR